MPALGVEPLGDLGRVGASGCLDEYVEAWVLAALVVPEERHIPEGRRRFDLADGDAVGRRCRESELADDADAERGSHERDEGRRLVGEVRDVEGVGRVSGCVPQVESPAVLTVRRDGVAVGHQKGKLGVGDNPYLFAVRAPQPRRKL